MKHQRRHKDELLGSSMNARARTYVDRHSSAIITKCVDRLVTGLFSHSCLDPPPHVRQEFWWSPVLMGRLMVVGGMTVQRTTYSLGLRVFGQVPSMP